MNTPTTRRTSKAYGVDQAGRREFAAWVDHKGKRHRMGTFNAKPEALRIAKGVFHGLHQRTRVIAAPGQTGPFPTWQDKAKPERSVDPDFCLKKTLINQMGPPAKNGGSVPLHGPHGSTPYRAAYDAERGIWRARVGTGKNRRWIGRFATKAQAEHAARLASVATP